MSGSFAKLAGPALCAVLDEPDQILLLQEFRAAHPDVIVGKGEFGTWQARIPHLAGETVAIRYTLRELMDRLSELLAEDMPAEDMPAEDNSAPGGCPPDASPDIPAAK